MNNLNASCAALFISLLGLLVLCIMKYTRTRKIRSCAAYAAALCLMLPVLSYYASMGMPKNAGRDFLVPYIVIQPAAVLILALSFAGIVIEYRKHNSEISPRSIKQALDHLNAGICYTDESGGIILMNYFFAEAVSSVSGEYPRSTMDIHKALESLTSTGDSLYRFPDGRILSFREDSLNDTGLEGTERILLHDVTEYSEINRSLQESNEQLRKSNDDIRILISRLSDMIREQETLSLKMKVHNEMGTALIAISGLRNGTDAESTDDRLRRLENAVRWFAGERVSEGRSAADLRKQSEVTGVGLDIDGEIPESAEDIICAAISECMTNCIRHAGGDKVKAKIRNTDGCICAEITNNGDAPAAEIHEGGGLSDLRRKTEQCGGTMQIQSRPEFMLRITLPGERIPPPPAAL